MISGHLLLPRTRGDVTETWTHENWNKLWKKYRVALRIKYLFQTLPLTIVKCCLPRAFFSISRIDFTSSLHFYFSVVAKKVCTAWILFSPVSRTSSKDPRSQVMESFHHLHHRESKWFPSCFRSYLFVPLFWHTAEASKDGWDGMKPLAPCITIC